MSDPHYGRFWFRVCIAVILLLGLCCAVSQAQPPGYRVQCSGGSCRLVKITTPASVRRFSPLRRDGRRFSTRSSVGIRSARHDHPRAGRLFWRGK